MTRSIQSLFSRMACALVFSGLLGCGDINGQIRSVFDRPNAQDFAKSEIITNGPGIADGQTELLVVIQLMNSDNTPVVNFKPTYQITSSSGINASGCTTSNIHGVSTCVLKSTQSGTKRLAVTNISITLEKDLLFNSPTSKPSLGLITASQKSTSGNHELSGSLGNQEPGAVKTSGSYQLFGGVQGDAFSR